MPRFVGATRCEGGRSPSKRNSFSEGPGQIVCAVQKVQPAICRGNRNPPGLELASEAAERGNYPEAKPNEERLKGRRAYKKDNSLWAVQQNEDDIRTAYESLLTGSLKVRSQNAAFREAGRQLCPGNSGQQHQCQEEMSLWGHNGFYWLSMVAPRAGRRHVSRSANTGVTISASANRFATLVAPYFGF